MEPTAATSRGAVARPSENIIFSATNWRGKPLESLEVINLIAATTTNTGVKVYARLDTDPYPKGVEVSDEEFSAINIHRHDFHGDWDYTISLQ